MTDDVTGKKVWQTLLTAASGSLVQLDWFDGPQDHQEAAKDRRHCLGAHEGLVDDGGEVWSGRDGAARPQSRIAVTGNVNKDGLEREKANFTLCQQPQHSAFRWVVLPWTVLGGGGWGTGNGVATEAERRNN
ncbi:hypothetical protein BaRGS_00006653 [Batillaria attramentaria]|uniref:Uncharacterized protein n=1 Tax=Batillaria attramentaria TaxID=370345 RepID=A0ABD0LRV6_9CAEN